MSFDAATEKARLDRIAEWYNNQKGVSAMSGRYAADLIIEHAAGPWCLEMGAGKGVVTERLAEHFPHLEVVEGASHNAAMVKNLVDLRAEVYWCLFEEFTPRQRYSDIVMGRMLGHVHDPIATLVRAKGWLSEGGRIHIVVPNAESLHRRIGVLLGQLETCQSQSENDVAVGQRRVYTAEMLRQHTEEAGLRIRHLEGTLLKPLSSAQMEEWPEELLAAFYQVARDLPPEWAAELYAECEVS